MERADERQRARERSTQPTPAPAPDLELVTPASAQAARSDPPGIGEVETALVEELKQHDGSPGIGTLGAAARALAREVDNPNGITSSANAVGKLLQVLTEIRKLSRQTDGELAELVALLGESP